MGGGRLLLLPEHDVVGYVREYGKLLYRRFLLMLKGAVFMSYVWPAILYGHETWCLKQSERGVL